MAPSRRHKNDNRRGHWEGVLATEAGRALAIITPFLHLLLCHSCESRVYSQLRELESMGLVLYLDSWIPLLENHHTGFLLADIPIDKLAELAEIDYIVRMETAERTLEPQDGFQPQG